jgi:formate hydrogenlyase transcriptional activator
MPAALMHILMGVPVSPREAERRGLVHETVSGQERTLERVGGLRPVAIDVRVLAATNRDLDAAIVEGSFRKDLFYRLNVFPVHLPALRERGGDIPLLVEYLVARYAQKAGKRIQRIGNETMDLFKRYSWPGNVRELQNVIERAVILCDGETFSVDASWFGAERSKPPVRPVTLASDLSAHEKMMIENALRQASGRVSGAKWGGRNTRSAEADPGVEATEARNQALSLQNVLIVQ